jgi:hypothetical protein
MLAGFSDSVCLSSSEDVTNVRSKQDRSRYSLGLELHLLVETM